MPSYKENAQTSKHASHGRVRKTCYVKNRGRPEDRVKEVEENVKRSLPQTLTSAGWDVLRGLAFVNAPQVFLKLIYLMLLRGLLAEELDFLEFFAGAQAVTTAMQAQGWTALAYEIKKDPINMDIMSPSGFFCAISYVLKLKSGAGCLLAPVCSSWVFLCNL
jgi:hypothetical protein